MAVYKLSVFSMLSPIALFALEVQGIKDSVGNIIGEHESRLIREEVRRPSATEVLREISPAAAKLSDREARGLNKVKNLPGAKKTKLFGLDQKSFALGSVRVEFSENEEVEFRLAKMADASAWEGRRERTSDRFVIRSVNGRYSGHFLYQGRLFVLTPIRSGISAFYELENKYDCGTEAKVEAK